MHKDKNRIETQDIFIHLEIKKSLTTCKQSNMTTALKYNPSREYIILLEKPLDILVIYSLFLPQIMECKNNLYIHSNFQVCTRMCGINKDYIGRNKTSNNETIQL